MDDKARMIAAARRRARRIARKTDITYQQALDRVARDLGRDHWAHYASDPVAVPRDGAPASPSSEPSWMGRQAEFMKAVLSPPGLHLPEGHGRTVPRMHEPEAFMLSGEDWNMPLEVRPPCYGSTFLPGWNALADRFVGEGVSERDRERHLESISGILIPGRGVPEYFADSARLTLVGFLFAELATARREGRVASIPAMVDWIAAGTARAGEQARRRDAESEASAVASRSDGMRDFLADLVDVLKGDGCSERAVVEIVPLVSMSPNERSGVLGTMDHGLLPFKAKEIREVNS